MRMPTGSDISAWLLAKTPVSCPATCPQSPPGNDLEDDEEYGSGEEEPEEESKAGFLVSDSEEEGQVCTPTICTYQGQVLCRYANAHWQ